MSEKRKVTVDGEEFEVEISPGEGVWEVSIEGRTYSVEVEGTKTSTKRKKELGVQRYRRFLEKTQAAVPLRWLTLGR